MKLYKFTIGKISETDNAIFYKGKIVLRSSMRYTPEAMYTQRYRCLMQRFYITVFLPDNRVSN